MEMFWFIPTTGDGRYLGSSHGSRLTDYAYLRQIAQAVDELGYGAVLLPTGNSCEDAWVVASTLMPSTKRAQVSGCGAAGSYVAYSGSSHDRDLRSAFAG